MHGAMMRRQRNHKRPAVVQSDRLATLPTLVPRVWSIPCDDCGHLGYVNATLKQIRRWVAEEKLVCTACGCIKQAFRSL